MEIQCQLVEKPKEPRPHVDSHVESRDHDHKMLLWFYYRIRHLVGQEDSLRDRDGAIRS